MYKLILDTVEQSCRNLKCFCFLFLFLMETTLRASYGTSANLRISNVTVVTSLATFCSCFISSKSNIRKTFFCLFVVFSFSSPTLFFFFFFFNSTHFSRVVYFLRDTYLPLKYSHCVQCFQHINHKARNSM